MTPPPSKSFCRFIKVSFSLEGKDILMDACVFWKEQDGYIELKEVPVTAAEVDGRKLNDDELEDFRLRHEAAYKEDLKWIALSSVNSSAT